jgi:hypothetical protein
LIHRIYFLRKNIKDIFSDFYENKSLLKSKFVNNRWENGDTNNDYAKEKQIERLQSLTTLKTILNGKWNYGISRWNDRSNNSKNILKVSSKKEFSFTEIFKSIEGEISMASDYFLEIEYLQNETFFSGEPLKIFFESLDLSIGNISSGNSVISCFIQYLKMSWKFIKTVPNTYG